jgi:hypothetical protein
MRTHVRVRAPDGLCYHLGHGDLIGRLWTAALTIDDARVSEAHAMVSLRGDTLKLLGLRGRFAIRDKPVTEVDLQPGLVVSLARGLELVVEDVVLPERVLALEGEGFARRVLAGVCSLVTRPHPQLVPGYRRGAAAHIWSAGDGWSVATADAEPRPLREGDALHLDGRTFTAVSVALSSAAGAETGMVDGVQAPLRLVAHFDTVHIQRAGEPTVALGGLPARILSELVTFGGPTAWTTVAGEIWRDVDDRHQLRHKWDVSLSRLRSKLRHARIRPDLVRADGSGNFELLLHPGDSVEDRT